MKLGIKENRQNAREKRRNNISPLGTLSVFSLLAVVGLIAWECITMYSYVGEGLNLTSYVPIRSIAGSAFMGTFVVSECLRREKTRYLDFLDDIFSFFMLFVISFCLSLLGCYLISYIPLSYTSTTIQEDLLIEKGYEKADRIEENNYYVEKEDKAYVVTIEQDRKELYFTIEETEKKPERYKLK